MLCAPTTLRELAVKITGGDKNLVFLPAGGETKVEWILLFPKMDEKYAYDFTIELQGFGQKQRVSVVGEAKAPSTFEENVFLSKLESVQGNDEVAVIATLSNAGNAEARASVSASLGTQVQQQSVLLQPGEERQLRFVFGKPLSQKQGLITITAPSKSIKQPFEIVESPSATKASPVVQGTDYTIVLIAVGGAVLLAGLWFFLKRKQASYGV